MKSAPIVAAVLLTPVLATAQQFDLSLADGRALAEVQFAAANQQGLAVMHKGVQHQFPWNIVLAVHGGAITPLDVPQARLHGGEWLRGPLVGGDERGEWLEVLSPSLGKVRIATDRLAALLLQPGAADAGELRVPEGVDEALFTRARIGLDVQAGTLHQFGVRGIRFQPDGQAEPRWFPPEALVGFAATGAIAREQGGSVELRTTSGDCLIVDVERLDGDQLKYTGEGGVHGTVRLSHLASLHVLGSATSLSALEPIEARESGFEGDVLYPWRRDQSAVGTPLCSGGRSYARGLGVHSRSRLTFRVPDGVRMFWTRVGIDDSSRPLALRAEVDVSVMLDQKEQFRGTLRRGDAAAVVGPFAVKPGQLLVLDVDFGRGRDVGDRVDWLLPVFLR